MGDMQERKLALKQIAMDFARDIDAVDESKVFDTAAAHLRRLTEVWPTVPERLDMIIKISRAFSLGPGADESHDVRDPSESSVVVTVTQFVDSPAPDVFERRCETAPEDAIEIAATSLERSADLMSAVLDETRRDLDAIELRRRNIDGVQAQTRAVLRRLTRETGR